MNSSKTIVDDYTEKQHIGFFVSVCFSVFIFMSVGDSLGYLLSNDYDVILVFVVITLFFATSTLYNMLVKDMIKYGVILNLLTISITLFKILIL